MSMSLLYKVQQLFLLLDAVSVEIGKNSRQKTPSVQLACGKDALKDNVSSFVLSSLKTDAERDPLSLQ